MIIKREFKSGLLAYKIKGNTVYNIIHANSLPLHTHYTPGMGSKGQSIFCEDGHNAYQIKENLARNKIQAENMTSKGWV